MTARFKSIKKLKYLYNDNRIRIHLYSSHLMKYTNIFIIHYIIPTTISDVYM